MTLPLAEHPAPSAPRGLDRFWFAGALAALGLGSLMAVVLVLAKVPLLATLIGLDRWFPVALVYHVNLTILVWVAAVAMLWWRALMAPWRNGLDRLSAGLALVGGVALLLPLLQQPQAQLSNYVPLIDAAAFRGGLGALLAAVALALLNRLAPLFRLLCRCPEQSDGMAALAALAWLAALAVLLLTLLRLPHAEPGVAHAEVIFWGFGHVLQMANLLLMLSLAMALGELRAPRFAARSAQGFGLALLLAALLVAAVYDPLSQQYRQLFTAWMRFFSVPFLLLLLWPLWQRRGRLTGSARVALMGSVGLCLIGALVGAAIRSDNLLVPAHYHAMTGALNLMLMVWMYRLSGRAPADQLRLRQLRLYLVGVVLMVTGLGLAGWLGVGRKLAGDAQGLSGAAHYLALALMGLGAGLALLGCFVFVWRLLRPAGRGAWLPASARRWAK